MLLMFRWIVSALVLLPLLAGCPRAGETTPHHPPSGFSLQMNYEGAEALIAVLEQRTVTDADINKLLAIHGVQAMVDNTTKYFPGDTRAVFRAAVKGFVTTRKSTIGHFSLDESYERSSEIHALIAGLKADPNLAGEIAEPLSRYMPPLGRFTVTVYGVSGGVSDGFVRDVETEPAFYIALNRADGDAHCVKLNITHELYHVIQKLARAKAFNPATAPEPVRLLSVIFDEGTATYVAEPMLGKPSFFRRSGPYTRMWRRSYEKNASPEKIAANFAEVDRLLSGLRSGSMTWKQASDVVFTGYGPGPYFVGYEMAKAIDRNQGPARIASLLQQHPAAFFRAYIDVYRQNAAAVPARFSRETEAYIDSIPLQ